MEKMPVSGAPPGGGTYFLGRYRVVDEIGIGGMASVHLARMDGPGGFQKWVAIKRIHAHLIEDDSFVHMFLDEARVAARISHPNVANVFDLGKDNDSYWIAMEYLHGEPLREVMRRTEEMGQPMPPEIACRVIADAAEGLHAAHELLGKNGEKLQLVHRDVTPHNLFVTYDGTTKVVDFGIAKFASRTSNTRAGTLKGKLAYMSPEQVHGEGIDRRTDIFALGVVLWELTTGQRLFRMESDLDTLAKVQECNVPRPSTIIRGYPIDLEKIVMKALAKNRGERFRTARELSRALQSLLMRRGLFIASDEVAAYVQVIFQDRIQKREAHLRWAADVTQTINLDGLVAKQLAQEGPSGHSQSESHAQDFSGDQEPPRRPLSAPPPPRPAAGQPALGSVIPAGPSGPPGAPGILTATGRAAVPLNLSASTEQFAASPGQARQAGLAKPTAKQLASTVGAPSAHNRANSADRASSPPPAPQGAPHLDLAAGNTANAAGSSAEGGGARRSTVPPPRLGFAAAMASGAAGGASGPSAPPGRQAFLSGGGLQGIGGAGQGGRASRPPVDPDDSGEDGPTMQAPPHLLANAVYPGLATSGQPAIGSPLGPGGVPVPTSSGRALDRQAPLPPPMAAFEDDDDPEDATLVTTARLEDGTPMPPGGRPALQRSGPVPQVYQPPAHVPPRHASVHDLLPPVVVAPLSDPRLAERPETRESYGGRTGQAGKAGSLPEPDSSAFPPTLAGIDPSMPAQPWRGGPAAQGQAFAGGYAQAPPFAPQPGQPHFGAAGFAGQHSPTMPPGSPVPMLAMHGAPGETFRYSAPGNRYEATEMAVTKKKPSVVLLVVAATFAALVLTTAMYAVISRATRPAVVVADGTGATGATRPTGVTGGVGGAMSGGGSATGDGPFSIVRAGFREAASPASDAPPVIDLPATPSPSGMNAPADPSTVPDSKMAGDAPGAAATAAPDAPSTAAVTDAPPSAQTVPAADGDPTATKATASAPTPPPAPTHHPSAAAPVARGLLTVLCTPQCSQINDNGHSLGAGPIFRREVPAGEHHVTLQSGSVTKTVSVIIVADSMKVVRQSMTP